MNSDWQIGNQLNRVISRLITNHKSPITNNKVMAKKVNIVVRFFKKVLHLVGKTDFNDRIFLMGNLRYVLFISALALFYIANTHYAEKNMRQINNLQKELRELESQYMTSKSELMYKSKLTEVAKLVKPYGLRELTKPPKKIVIGD